MNGRVSTLFLSTPSARRATRCRALLTASRRNFYPRPPRGGRRCAQSVRTSATIFLSTPSARRATRRSARGWSACINFYPRPPRGGRHGRRRRPHDGNGISIHALREEGDTVSADSVDLGEKFLSTPSARRATWHRRRTAMSDVFLSTPSARRATGCPRLPFRGPRISIHALREEGDEHKLTERDLEERFLSTPSARRATYAKVWNEWFRDISIHALREEGDRPVDANGREACYFYPRPPRGGRPGAEHMTGYTALFLSTPSARRATPVRR